MDLTGTEGFLTTEEVLAYLQVNLRTVYRLIDAGKLPAVRVGRQWRFRRKDIDAWLDSQRGRGQPPPAVPAPGRSTGSRALVVDPDGAGPRPRRRRPCATPAGTVDTAPDGLVAARPAAARGLRPGGRRAAGCRASTPSPSSAKPGAARPALRVMIVTGSLHRDGGHRGAQPRRRRLSREAEPGHRDAARRRSASARVLAARTREPGPHHDSALVAHQALRRPRPARHGHLADRRPRPRRAVRPERRRQDHAAASMLAGLDEADGGEVIRPTALTIGYLPQDGLAHAGRTVFDEASEALRAAARHEGRDARPRAPAGRRHRAGRRARRDARALQRAAGPLPPGRRLHHRPEAWRRSCAASASRRPTSRPRPSTSRAAGRCASRWPSCCCGEPGLLLLDEPTNHLDLEARNWLEEYLARYPHAVILVSHDRYFLDAVVDRIADLSLRTLTDYVGNYTQYLVQRDERLERLREAKKRQDEEVGAGAGVHRPVPLPGDQGRAGAEPDQDAREGRAHRGAARAQAHPLPVPGGGEERPDRARARRTSRKAYGAEGGVRRRHAAHRARRPHRARRARTAPASRR